MKNNRGFLRVKKCNIEDEEDIISRFCYIRLKGWYKIFFRLWENNIIVVNCNVLFVKGGIKVFNLKGLKFIEWFF